MTWTSDPIRDAELYAIERSGNVVGYCTACGCEIYGKSRNFDGETYILDNNGYTVHTRMKCMKRHFKNNMLDWMLDDFGKAEVELAVLDTIKNPEQWLLNQCKDRNWVQG